MKIAHIGNVCRIANGIGTVIKSLSIAQRNNGNDVLVLTALKKIDALPEFHEIHSKSEFKSLMLSFNPDIFIFHSLYIWEYIGFFKILLKLKIPFLIQLHGALSIENYNKNHYKKLIANSLFYGRFLKKAHAIIYLNKGEYEKSIVKRFNPNSCIIPNGCTKPIAFPSMSIRQNSKIEILYLGRIDYYHKGLDILINALSILQENGYADYVHFKFFGIGNNDSVTRFEKDITTISDIAEYYGPAYDMVKDEAFRNANIFILTSRSEGFPMGILEAISYGLPCIVTPATNVADIIDNNDCGWVTELDSTTIVKTIKYAIEQYHERKDKLFQNCINLANKYTWDAVAKKSIQTYQNAISNKP